MLRLSLSLLIATIALSACAVVTSNEDGVRRVIGFVDVTYEKYPEVKAETLTVSSVGVLGYATPQGAGLSIGAQEISLTGVTDDAVIRIGSQQE